MKTIDVTAEAVQAFADAIGDDRPFFLVNLLRYKERADYGDRPDVAPCSGREAYFGRYAPAFNAVAATEGITGIKVSSVGHVLAHVIAPPAERWDDVAIVEYPNLAAFRRVIDSPSYKANATPHRKAALDDSRLIATSQVILPG